VSDATGSNGAAGTEPQPIAFGPFPPEKPELLVLAAFAGGFVLAKVLRRMGR
jgi:hypothetical protein